MMLLAALLSTSVATNVVLSATNGVANVTNGVAVATNAVTEAKITSDTTYYDRKEGIVVFKGHVHVDDAEYQMHSDRGYLFLSETNSLKRIVATGGVALTNGQRRAYGDSVTYRRDIGLVILRGTDDAPAVVSETTDSGERMVQGRKIRFWVNQEQVEVVEAVISAPKSSIGSGGLPGMLHGKGTERESKRGSK